MLDKDNLLFNLTQSLQLKVENSNYIVYLKDLKDNFVWMNPYAKKLLSTCDEKAKNALFANDLGIGRDNKLVSKVYFIESDNPFSDQNRSFAFSKWAVDVQETGSRYIFGFGFEITQFLLDSTPLGIYKKTLNLLTDAFVITEPKPPFNIVYCNSSFEHLCGEIKKNIIGKPPTHLLGKNNLDEEVRNDLNKKLVANEPAEAVFRNKNTLSEELIIYLKTIPLYFSGSKEPNYIIGIQKDITESFNTKEVQRLKAAKLKALFSITSNYIWLLDEQGHIIEMNDTAKLQGKYLETVDNINFVEGRWWNNNYTEIKYFIDEVFKTKKAASIKTKLLTSLNKEIIVTLQCVPVFKDNLKCFAVEAVDITDLEEALKDAKAVAAGALKETYGDDIELDESFISFSNDQIERITRAEVGLNHLKPKVDRLEENVVEIGNVVRNNSDLIKDQTETLTDIKESIINPNVVKVFNFGFKKLFAANWFKYLLIFFLGGSSLGIISNVENFLNLFEQFNSNVHQVEELLEDTDLH